MSLTNSTLPQPPGSIGFFAILKRIFNRLSVGQKVMTIIAVEILSYSVITSIALYQIHLMGSEIKQMANLYIPLLSEMETVRRQIQDERLQFKDVVFHGDRVVYDADSEETYIAARTLYKEAGATIPRPCRERSRNARGRLPRPPHRPSPGRPRRAGPGPDRLEP